jgi:hypothetical protein
VLGHTAHPDVATYALFFAALLLASSRNQRLLPSMLWSLLIPVKLIAVTFLPAAAGADRLISQKSGHSYSGGTFPVCLSAPP